MNIGVNIVQKMIPTSRRKTKSWNINDTFESTGKNRQSVWAVRLQFAKRKIIQHRHLQNLASKNKTWKSAVNKTLKQCKKFKHFKKKSELQRWSTIAIKNIQRAESH